MNSTSIQKKAFAGATVVLTGAASGLGKAMTRLLADAGAEVFALDVNGAGLDRLVEECPGNIHAVQADVTDLDAYRRIGERIIGLSGKVDYLFNNAGITLLGEAQNLPFPRWKTLMDINLMGAVNGTQVFYPSMIIRKSGRIINTASIAGTTGYATATAYTASKAAVLEFSRSLRAEAKNYGVGVSVACPGYVDTGIFAEDRIVGADRGQMIRDLPVKMMSPDYAAGRLLDGVAKGKGTIIFPFSAKFLWTLSCWAPPLIRPFHKRFMRTFQAKKRES
ncbi:MAG: SDR family oxidoreductase [Luteolibacter sp.]